jgi:hypothetical protein
MRLTRYHKQAFVNAVLNDVPEVDHRNTAKKMIEASVLRALPDIVRNVALSEHKDYLQTQFHPLPPPWSQCIRVFKSPPPLLTAEEKDSLKQLAKEETEDRDKRYALREKLRVTINSCSTVKQAHALMPELSKYLPEESTVTKQLPQVSGLMVDLTKAGLKL